MTENLKWIKLCYGVVMQLFVYLFSELFEFDNIFIVIFLNIAIYIVPYFYTVFLIRSSKITSYKQICILDLVFYLIPSIIACPIYESFAIIITGKTGSINGLFSLIMILIYILVYLLYLLIYKINFKITKKHR